MNKIKFKDLKVGDMFQCDGDTFINYDYPKSCICIKTDEDLASEIHGISFYLNEHDEVTKAHPVMFNDEMVGYYVGDIKSFEGQMTRYVDDITLLKNDDITLFKNQTNPKITQGQTIGVSIEHLMIQKPKTIENDLLTHAFKEINEIEDTNENSGIISYVYEQLSDIILMVSETKSRDKLKFLFALSNQLDYNNKRYKKEFIKTDIESNWYYNFVSMPNKRINSITKERQKLNLKTLEWDDTFEDKRTDEELIKNWINIK